MLDNPAFCFSSPKSGFYFPASIVFLMTAAEWHILSCSLKSSHRVAIIYLQLIIIYSEFSLICPKDFLAVNFNFPSLPCCIKLVSLCQFGSSL